MNQKNVTPTRQSLPHSRDQPKFSNTIQTGQLGASITTVIKKAVLAYLKLGLKLRFGFGMNQNCYYSYTAAGLPLMSALSGVVMILLSIDFNVNFFVRYVYKLLITAQNYNTRST